MPLFLRYITHEYLYISFQYCSILFLGDSKKLLHQLWTPRSKNARSRYHIPLATYQDVLLTQNTEIELLVLTFDTHMGLYQQRRRLPSHIPQLREEIIGIFACRTGLVCQHRLQKGWLWKPTNQPTNQPLKKVHCSEGLFLVAGLLKGSG